MCRRSLQHKGHPVAIREATAPIEPVSIHLFRALADEAAKLPGVRRKNSLIPPLPKEIKVAVKGVYPIRVDNKGPVEFGVKPPDKGHGLIGPSESRTYDDHVLVCREFLYLVEGRQRERNPGPGRQRA